MSEVAGTPPVALTIAGADSGGGAGAYADLRTFAAHGVHGTCALTVLTAQNTAELRAVHLVPTEFVMAQIDAVLADLAVRAVKTGMLASATTVAAVASRDDLPNLVVDPVLVNSRQDRMFGPEVEASYRERLVPRAAVCTPNLAEAAILAGGEVRTLAEMAAAARALAALGPAAVVVTGGGRPDGGDAVDVVCAGGEVFELRAPWVETANVHGSGCTLAAAIAAGLAHGLAVGDAVRAARSFLARALAGAVSWTLGAGHGPLDQFGWGGAPPQVPGGPGGPGGGGYTGGGGGAPYPGGGAP